MGRFATMRPTLALLTTMLLGVIVCGCGGASTKTHSTYHVPTSAAARNYTPTEPALNYTKADSDKDNDIGAPDDDTQNTSALDFGHAASAPERQTITALVKRYYAAALAENGAKACSMIYSTLAAAVPEDYGGPPGPLYMRGAKTCAAAVTLLFKHFHTLLTLQVPRLKVARVRLIEHHGLALLNFGKLPEREIYVAREGHIWRMSALLDGELQ
jgi:hypothetical protein